MALAAAMAACNSPQATPTNSPVGAKTQAELGSIPQPHLATIDLGEAGPGFDGSGSFFSYDSDLDPGATIGAYASQLLKAGFREAGTNGMWQVFIGPRLTVWVQVGSGGPPTSLLVRIQPTAGTDLGRPYPHPAIAAPTNDAGGTGGTAGGASPKPSSRPADVRRPDPPHGTGGATAGGAQNGSSGGGAVTGSGSTGTGAGTGTGSGNGVTGGSGSGSGGTGPRP